MSVAPVVPPVVAPPEPVIGKHKIETKDGHRYIEIKVQWQGQNCIVTHELDEHESGMDSTTIKCVQATAKVFLALKAQNAEIASLTYTAGKRDSNIDMRFTGFQARTQGLQSYRQFLKDPKTNATLSPAERTLNKETAKSIKEYIADMKSFAIEARDAAKPKAHHNDIEIEEDTDVKGTDDRDTTNIEIKEEITSEDDDDAIP